METKTKQNKVKSNAQTEPRDLKAAPTKAHAKNQQPPSVGSSALLGSVSYFYSAEPSNIGVTLCSRDNERVLLPYEIIPEITSYLERVLEAQGKGELAQR